MDDILTLILTPIVVLSVYGILRAITDITRKQREKKGLYKAQDNSANREDESRKNVIQIKNRQLLSHQAVA